MSKDIFHNASGQRVILTEQLKRQIRHLYSSIVVDIASEVKKLKGRDNISSILRRAYLTDLSDELGRQIIHTGDVTEELIRSSMLRIALEVVKDNQDFLNKVGFKIVNAYSHVPQDIVARVASGELYKGKWSLSSSIWQSSQKALNDIDSIVAKGIAQNKSVYDIAKDLEKYVNPSAQKDWQWSKVYPNTNKVIDYNAQRLARTMISHAYEESFVRVTQNNPFIENYQWLISNSDRVCPICQERANNDSYGLGPGIYPKNALPLDHPNGMCTFVTVMSKSYKEIAEELALWTKAEEGTYPAIDRYAEDMKTFL